MRAIPGVPLERVELSGETAVVIECLEDPVHPGHILLDVRLHRREGDKAGCVMQPTAPGFRVPLHEAEKLADAIVKVATHGAQAALWPAPTASRE